MTTLLVDLNLIFQQPISYTLDEIESALESHANVYHKLSQAADYYRLPFQQRSFLRTMLLWLNDTELFSSETRRADPDLLEIMPPAETRLEIAKLRAFMEAARGNDYYLSGLHADVTTIIRDWEKADFELIFIGLAQSDRMRFALRAARLNDELPCRRLAGHTSLQRVLSEFDLDHGDAVVVGRDHTPYIFSWASQCSLYSVCVGDSFAPAAARSQHVAKLSDVLSVLGPTTPFSKAELN